MDRQGGGSCHEACPSCSSTKPPKPRRPPRRQRCDYSGDVDVDVVGSLRRELAVELVAVHLDVPHLGVELAGAGPPAVEDDVAPESTIAEAGRDDAAEVLQEPVGRRPV